MTILHTDNEENGETALRILGSPAYAGQREGPLAEVMEPLTTFCVSLVESTNLMLEPIRQPEGVRQSQVASGQPEHLEAANRAPARLLSGVARLVAAQNDAGDVALLQALAPRAWTALRGFPDDALHTVRDRRLYRRYLCGAVQELLGLLDLAWSR